MIIKLTHKEREREVLNKVGQLIFARASLHLKFKKSQMFMSTMSSSTLSFLISPHVKVSEEDLWSLVGRDELHIEQATSSTDKQEGNLLLKFGPLNALLFGKSQNL